MKLKNKIFKATVYDGGFCWKNPRFETVDFKLKDFAFSALLLIVMAAVYAQS